MADLDFDNVKKWDRKNPQFYDLFKKFTLEATNKGYRELSGWLVANRIRWETMIITEGSDWKVPNGCIAYYTRLFMVEFPQHRSLFATRPLRCHVTQEQLKEWLDDRKCLV